MKACKSCVMMSLPDSPCPMSRRAPTEPWQNIHLDFKEGPSNESILVCVCSTTRYTQVEHMRNPTTAMVSRALIRWFAAFGVPQSITADNGPQFKSAEFQKFCNSFGINLHLTTPYWPQQNGAVERQNRNIGHRIKISIREGTDVKMDLQEYLLMYHTTPQETTGLTPGKMMFNRELYNGIPMIEGSTNRALEGAAEKDWALKEQKREYADAKRRAKPNDVQLGDKVLLRNYNKGAYQPTFSAEEHVVTATNGNEVVVQSTETDKVKRRNRSHVKILQSQQQQEEEEREEDNLQVQTHREEETDYGVEETSKKQIDENARESASTGSLRAKRVVKRPNRYDSFQLY